MSVKAVFKGLLAETEEHKQQLVEGFKEMGFHPPKVLHVFKTLPTPGEPGTGGRSDVLIEVNMKDVSKLAVHPMHLSGDMSWLEDYMANCRAIIPVDALKVMTCP